MLTVIVPAHNEEAQIADTIESLLLQTVPPQRIVVVSDNSTDDTVAIARTFPVTVMETEGNTFRKAGALNQAWLAHCQDSDYVFTMDADTILAPNFFELAVAHMESNPKLGGSCACPMMKKMPTLTLTEAFLWRMSKLDYGGYLRILVRWKFVPEVLSGYGSLFRAEALREVASLSANNVPWDTSSIVEDYKISLDTRRLGWDLSVIPGAHAFTDTPRSFKELWVQRVRWVGGTWQEIFKAGWDRHTRRTWMNMILAVIVTALRVVAVSLWILVLALGMEIAFSPLWLIPIAVGIADRIDMTRYTHGADWKDRFLAVALLPMELMAILRESWTVKSAWTVLRRRNLEW